MLKKRKNIKIENIMHFLKDRNWICAWWNCNKKKFNMRSCCTQSKENLKISLTNFTFKNHFHYDQHYKYNILVSNFNLAFAQYKLMVKWYWGLDPLWNSFLKHNGSLNLVDIFYIHSQMFKKSFWKHMKRFKLSSV